MISQALANHVKHRKGAAYCEEKFIMKLAHCVCVSTNFARGDELAQMVRTCDHGEMGTNPDQGCNI